MHLITALVRRRRWDRTWIGIGSDRSDRSIGSDRIGDRDRIGSDRIGSGSFGSGSDRDRFGADFREVADFGKRLLGSGRLREAALPSETNGCPAEDAQGPERRLAREAVRHRANPIDELERGRDRKIAGVAERDADLEAARGLGSAAEWATKAVLAVLAGAPVAFADVERSACWRKMAELVSELGVDALEPFENGDEQAKQIERSVISVECHW